jgi:hypothetical protein
MIEMFKFENITSLFYSFYIHIYIFKISFDQIWLFMLIIIYVAVSVI